MLSLSADDHAKVSAAIAAAEAKSDGEIIAIAADQSDAYHDVGLHYAVLVLFLVLAFFAIWPHQLELWWTRLMGWTAEPSMRQLLTLLLGLALLKFLVGAVHPEMAAAAAAADARIDQDPPGAAARGDAVQDGRGAAHDRAHRHPHLSVDGRASRRDRRRRGDHRGDHAGNLGRGDGRAAEGREGRPAGRRDRRGGRTDRRRCWPSISPSRARTATKSRTS